MPRVPRIATFIATGNCSSHGEGIGVDVTTRATAPTRTRRPGGRPRSVRSRRRAASAGDPGQRGRRARRGRAGRRRPPASPQISTTPGRARRDDRHARAHRLQHGQAEALVQARVDQRDEPAYRCARCSASGRRPPRSRCCWTAAGGAGEDQRQRCGPDCSRWSRWAPRAGVRGSCAARRRRRRGGGRGRPARRRRVGLLAGAVRGDDDARGGYAPARADVRGGRRPRRRRQRRRGGRRAVGDARVRRR